MFVWTFLLRITHTIISQSNADSSWITLYIPTYIYSYIYIRTYIHTHINTYTHKYVRTYIHSTHIAQSVEACATTGRSRVRFPMGPLENFIDIILPAALRPWVRISLNRNGYREYFLGSKHGRRLGMTALPPSRADYFEIRKPQTPGKREACTATASPLHTYISVKQHTTCCIWTHLLRARNAFFKSSLVFRGYALRVGLLWGRNVRGFRTCQKSLKKKILYKQTKPGCNWST